MDLNYKIVSVDERNLTDYPQVVCFTNKKHPYHHIKMDWIKDQFKYGLKIKLLFLKEEKGPVGFIEYVSGENCWRAVDAKGYLFIHCLWTNRKKYQHRGLGTVLIKEVEKDAADKKGVTVVTSDRAFMTNKEIFLKNEYSIVEEDDKEQLLVKQFSSSKLPRILDHKSNLKKEEGLKILYSNQCPWVSRFIHDIKPTVKEANIKLNVKKIISAEEAQKAPSLYSVFNLIYNGKILADRYISVTRFKNILQKELIY